MSITVRPEKPGEEAVTGAIHEAAFGRPAEAAIVDAIRGTDDWIAAGSLLAVDELKRPLGHVLVSRGRLKIDGGAEREIAMVGPVGVLPNAQGEGVGTALMRAAISLGVRSHMPLICLLGDPGYYSRFKFEPGRAVGIDPPQDWPDDSWMVLRTPDWTPGLRGTAHYAPGFGEG